jgi:hypothetical protein
MELNYEMMGPEPLRQLFDSYNGCLALNQGYLDDTKREDELDLDRLELFLRARAELLAEAEESFKALESLKAAGLDDEDPDRQALLRQVVEVLEEMTGLENCLSAFLGERLREIGETICQLRRIQPVFQRYSHLGGDKADPSLITRRE